MTLLSSFWGLTQKMTNLSNEITVSDYLQMEKEKNKSGIVRFIRSRFTERYITPLRSDPKIKHGFCTMAICCLMIETLESFWQGWDTSEGKSKSAFSSFFKRNQNFRAFNNHVEDFYKNVRCGILHQAETTNGWHIRRDGWLFNKHTKTINATLFHDEIENCLDYYCSILNQEDWNSETWVNFRKKMRAIISHCSE